jgi:hypothetical protein
MKPSTSRPYYYIIYKEEPVPNDRYTEEEEYKNYVPDSKKISGQRYGNSTKPIM